MAQVAHPSSCNEKETDAKTEKMNVREGQEAAGSRYPLQYRGALYSSVAKLCPGLLTLHVIPLPCLTAWAELCFPQIHVLLSQPPEPQNVTSFGDGALKEAIKLKWALMVGHDTL